MQKIHGELKKKGLLNLKVGSVEEFQGQERLIIILSTVRSNPRFLTTDNKFGIGFLQNDKVSVSWHLCSVTKMEKFLGK